MNKSTGIVYLIMGVLCFATAASMGFTLYQQQAVIDQQQKDMAFIKDHLDGIYTTAVTDNSRTYTIMDTIIRIFHYAKPHKGSTWNCPECEDIRKGSKGEKTKTEKTAAINQPETIEVDVGTAALAVALQNIHQQAIRRDTAIVMNVLKTQHHLKMHSKQKVRMCPDCMIGNAAKEKVASKSNIDPERIANALQGSRRHVENPKGYAASRSEGP